MKKYNPEIYAELGVLFRDSKRKNEIVFVEMEENKNGEWYKADEADTEISKLKARIEKLKEALRFYDDEMGDMASKTLLDDEENSQNDIKIEYAESGEGWKIDLPSSIKSKK